VSGGSPTASPDPGSEQRAEAIFLAALDRAPAQLEAYVERACGRDDGLRHSVPSLRRAHQRTGPVDCLVQRTGQVRSNEPCGGVLSLLRDRTTR